ncbi:MAG: hypothetical protein FJ291_24240 [Planctomycetes bacterium]|nr:hypothetical protein [Planctomycetota bacterium]
MTIDYSDTGHFLQLGKFVLAWLQFKDLEDEVTFTSGGNIFHSLDKLAEELAGEFNDTAEERKIADKLLGDFRSMISTVTGSWQQSLKGWCDEFLAKIIAPALDVPDTDPLAVLRKLALDMKANSETLDGNAVTVGAASAASHNAGSTVIIASLLDREEWAGIFGGSIRPKQLDLRTTDTPSGAFTVIGNVTNTELLLELAVGESSSPLTPQATIPAFSACLDMADVKQRQHGGCYVDKLTFEASQAGQILRVTCEYLAMNAAAAARTTPAFLVAEAPLLFGHAALTADGDAFYASRLRLALLNDLQGDHLQNSKTRLTIPRGIIGVEGELEINFNADTWANFVAVVDSATATALVATFTNGSYALAFTLPAVQIPEETIDHTPGKGKVASLGTSIKSSIGDAATRGVEGLYRVLDRLGAKILSLGKWVAAVGVGLAGWAVSKGVGFAAQLEHAGDRPRRPRPGDRRPEHRALDSRGRRPRRRNQAPLRAGHPGTLRGPRPRRSRHWLRHGRAREGRRHRGGGRNSLGTSQVLVLGWFLLSHGLLGLAAKSCVRPRRCGPRHLPDDGGAGGFAPRPPGFSALRARAA